MSPFAGRWALIACLICSSVVLAEDDAAGVQSDTAGSVAASATSVGDAARFVRVFEKARRGEPITVGFLGGSITQGYAASTPAHRYADRITAWLGQQFPKSAVKAINAGVGGTGSNYGSLRVQHDLLSQKPDIVFVEFAVNDDDNRNAAPTLEGVVRQVLNAPGSPACLLLFMSHDGRNAQQWHAQVGQHYGLPMVSYRDGLAREINAGRFKWTDISPDDIHPNDRGHAIAARYVTAMLQTLLDSAHGPARPTAELPRPLFTDLYANVESHDAAALRPTRADGWTYDAKTESWIARTPGSVIEFETTGRGVSLMYYRIHKDFGRVSAVVDDRPAQTFDGWFNQTWGGYRQTSDLATDLAPGRHRVRIELLADKAEQSNGHEFRILGLAALGVAAQPAPPERQVPAYEWKNVPIHGGGYISGVYAHPAAPGLFYCKTDIGGAYRRENDGPWQPLTDWIGEDNWTYSGMESLALDPHDPDAVYLAAGTYTNSWSGPGAFLLSHDRGRTWKTVPVPFKMGGNDDGRNQGERLAVDPNDGRVLWFGSRKNGVWKSVDRGETWSPVRSFPLPDDAQKFGTPFVVLDSTSGKPGSPTSTIVVGCDSATVPLLRSTDAGETWTAVAGGPKGLLPHQARYAANGSLIVSFANGVGPNGVTDGAVFRLEADARTWTDISPIKPGPDDRFGYCGVTVSPRDPATILVTTLDRWGKIDDIFRSHDNGRTWTSLHTNAERDAASAPWIAEPSRGAFGHWISSVAIDPADPQHLLYVTGWGMWESRDTANAEKKQATHWTFAATGIDELVMTDLVSPPTGPHVLSTLWDLDGFAHEDVDRSPAGGYFKPWTGRSTSIDFAESSPGVVARVFGGQVLGKPTDAVAGGAISRDSGATWTPFTAKPKNAMDGVVAVSADGATILWTPDGQETVRSTGRLGETWVPVIGLPWNLRVITDRVDPKSAYAFDPATGVAYASADGGATFRPAATGLPTGDGYLRASPARAGDLWLAGRGGLFHSRNGGASFDRTDGLASASCIGFGKALGAADSPAMYAVGRKEGQYGFYRSDDAGRTWTRINDDRHQFMQIVAISGDPRIPGRVYVASRSRGILRGDVRSGEVQR